MVDLLNACMKDEMRRDPKHRSSSARTSPTSRASEHLGKVKGKGGVFKVTWGLQKEFGGARVYNSPLAEANIVGRAIGLALRGFKPVVEIQFFDYIWPAYMQIRDELATMRWRSNNAFAAPVVIRTTYGGYIRGAIYHSQTGASLFTHCPGLRVICPATALDANGLLRTAIRCDDPVIFLEHKHLYRQTYNKARVSRPELHDPVREGEGRARRDGRHGRDVRRHRAARVHRGEPGGGARASRVEVIDLRSLSPWDQERGVRVGEEDESRRSWRTRTRSRGATAPRSRPRIADDCFAWLDAPVKRVASTDTFVGLRAAARGRDPAAGRGRPEGYPGDNALLADFRAASYVSSAIVT